MENKDTKIIIHKLESMETRIGAIENLQGIHNAHLESHMKRTENVEEALLPIKDHVNQMKGAGKLLGVLAVIGSIVTAVLVILNGGS